MNWNELKQINTATWFVLLGTLFSKAAFFVSMPYLALNLQTRLGLDPVTIGWTLGIGPFVGIWGGFYIGHLSDKLGRRTILITSILIWALAFFGFAYAEKLWQFALLNTISGLCSAAYYPVSSALISDLTTSANRKLVFHLRYYVSNVAAALGPLAGAGFALYNPKLGFLMTGLVYVIYGLASVKWLPKRELAKASNAATTFRETMQSMWEDRPLLYYTLAFVVMGLTYSQLESTLPQYLNLQLGAEGVRLFGILIGINGLTVVLFQLPMTKLTARLALPTTIVIGSVLYGVGFAMIGVTGPHHIGLMSSMVLLTLGEILVFSNANLIIDSIAPEGKKGAYFGASGLWALGPTIGPAIGGYVLVSLGGPNLFIILGVVAIANLLFYRFGQRASKRREAEGAVSSVSCA